MQHRRKIKQQHNKTNLVILKLSYNYNRERLVGKNEDFICKGFCIS